MSGSDAERLTAALTEALMHGELAHLMFSWPLGDRRATVTRIVNELRPVIAALVARLETEKADAYQQGRSEGVEISQAVAVAHAASLFDDGKKTRAAQIALDISKKIARQIEWRDEYDATHPPARGSVVEGTPE